jgi:hypothetical protein
MRLSGVAAQPKRKNHERHEYKGYGSVQAVQNEMQTKYSVSRVSYQLYSGFCIVDNIYDAALCGIAVAFCGAPGRFGNRNVHAGHLWILENTGRGAVPGSGFRHMVGDEHD